MVENYSDIEELLSTGEMKGRRWVFDRAQSAEHAGTKPSDHDILDLHVDTRAPQNRGGSEAHTREN